MRGPVVRSVIVIALTLAAFAGSASAGTATFDFGTTTTGGTWAVTNPGGALTIGSSYGLTGLTDVIFSNLTVAGDPVAADNTTYTLDSTGCTGTSGAPVSGGTSSGAILVLSGSGSNETLSLYGASTSFANLGSGNNGCNLLATLTGAFTGKYLGASGQFTFDGVSGFSVNSNLLSDLSLSTYQPTGLAGGQVINGGSGSLTTNGGSNTETYTATSETFTMNVTSTPEPASLALSGTGLAFLFVFAFRRRLRVPGPTAPRTDS